MKFDTVTPTFTYFLYLIKSGEWLFKPAGTDAGGGTGQLIWLGGFESMSTPVARISLLSDQGKGRAFVILMEGERYRDFAAHLAESLAARTRVILVQTALLDDHNWRDISTDVIELLKTLALRQVSFVGLGPASTVVQNIVLQEPKLVRMVSLVDASCRPHSTVWSKIIHRLEKSLPLGLPLRSRSDGFDSSPFLQRIRCPALIVLSSFADTFLERQSDLLSSRIPTSWMVRLSSTDQARELSALVLEFEQVPVKCPQKNLAVAAV